MSNAEIRGRFVWHELMTTDPQAAIAFYSKVLPWKTQASGVPGYTLWVAGKTMTGGLMAQPEPARQAGAPPSWLVYIGTPDVDAAAAAAERLGGKVLKAPDDIPNVGRFAVLADPQGAAFAVFTPRAMPAGAGAPPPSDFSWHELATSDPQGALAFYSELFGWSRGPAHDMGPGGIYQLIAHGGAEVGGIYKVMDASKPPHWLTYIRVASVDRAAAAAKEAGGRVTQGPMEVPGGSRIAQILDPQGGAFAVHEPARQAAAASAPAKSRPGPRKRPARKAPVRPAKKAAKQAKKRPAVSKRAARKPAARKSTARKAAARKVARKRAAPSKAAAKRKSARRPARKAARRRR